MSIMKKYFAELFGTFVLVLFGCGTASISGGINGILGVLGIAFAFGLSIVAMAYVIGGISGCHINPAVSLGMLLTGKMNLKDFIGYIVAQFAGGIAAIAALKGIIADTALNAEATGLGANGYGPLSFLSLDLGGAIVVEIILTCVFVLTVFGITSSEKNSHLAGLVIGLALVFVHIMGIPLTGTSVNPARSFGPALFLGGEAFSQVWVFITAPLAGAVLAALIWKYFRTGKVKQS
jgi:aquaporin Z